MSDITDDHGAAECWKELTREGKEISIQVRITDSTKATELAASIHRPELAEKFGVEVLSWGLYNIEKARNNQLQAVNDKLRQAMEELLSMTGITTDPRQFLEEGPDQP